MDINKFIISKDGSAMCSILYTDSIYKSPSEILSTYLKTITTAEIELNQTTDYANAKGKIIFVYEDVSDSGFSIYVENDNLCIAAKTEQAAIYAVYDLLEKFANCRFYSSKVEVIPNNPSLVLEVENYQFTPILDFREVYYQDYKDKEFAQKHKASPAHAHEGWGFWCHSFQTLLPNELFEKHPEYFALIDGERKKNAEPCLSNPEVLEIMYNNLKKHIEEKPEAKYWSVSQNDDASYCRCEKCKALDDIDDGPMGSILTFVNEIASRFPDKTISTLAYWYSRKPPKVTRPAKNVHIMLCNIEVDRGKPIETSKENEGSKNELLEWAKICDNVFLWDYCIQFANLVSPFPNLRLLAPNLRFFVENNVRALFSQCNREIAGEFAELRGYLLAKLMWNPYADDREIMIDFLNGYYGAAGEYILKYIDKTHDEMEKAGERLDIFNGPKNAKETYLSKELFIEYQDLFDKAEESVKDNEDLFPRVRQARMPLYYTGLVNKYGTKDELISWLTQFAILAKACNLEKVEEWKITVDMFVTSTLIEIGEE